MIAKLDEIAETDLARVVAGIVDYVCTNVPPEWEFHVRIELQRGNLENSDRVLVRLVVELNGEVRHRHGSVSVAELVETLRHDGVLSVEVV